MRRYRWDRLDQIIQESVTDSDAGAGEEKYRQQLWGYDATGHVTRSVGPAQEARFSWDAAGNRTEAPGQKVWHNLLQRLNGIRLAYDGFGRLAERRDTRHGLTQRFHWDEENRLSDVELEGHRDYRRAEYRYDLLGRRTHKLLYRHDRAEPEITTFQWNGLRLVGEESSGAPGKKTQYVYSEGSWEPLARVDSSAAGSEVYWYHTELNGLPERMTDAQGETVWQGTFSTWGETQREQSHAPLAVAQNLRFQGQYLDRETGLHYNLFRYYDPATGRYTQPDPIGLAGGLNTYAYVHSPLSFIDPLGLAASDYPWNIKNISFGEWFDTASTQDVKDAMANKTVKAGVTNALRNGGGAHEWFPVSMADKAKSLGFTYNELIELSTPRANIWFENVPDPRGNGALLEGPHSTGAKLPAGQSGRASSIAHIILSRRLNQATSKIEAVKIIRAFSSQYVRNGSELVKTFKCGKG